MSGGGADDGTDTGDDVGAPDRAEATGDPAVGHGGTQFALGAVVVSAQLGMVEEREQMAAQLPSWLGRHVHVLSPCGLIRVRILTATVKANRVGRSASSKVKPSFPLGITLGH